MAGMFAFGEVAKLTFLTPLNYVTDVAGGQMTLVDEPDLSKEKFAWINQAGATDTYSLDALPSGLNLVAAAGFRTILVDPSFAGYVEGRFAGTLYPSNASTLVGHIPILDYCDIGGGYNSLVYSAIGLNIAPFPVPFLSTEKPSITYYAGASPGGDVLITITDPTGAPVVTAENMTQVGGTDRWDYVLNTAFAVTGLYKVQCLINGDTSSYRTSSFVWASATDPSFGSYQALATKTTATQTLAQALHAKEFNRLYVDTNTNTMTLYDVDNTTPLFVWALLPSATNILDRVPD